MAVLTVQAELTQLQEAIQQLTGGATRMVSFTVDGQTYTYAADHLKQLQERELLLLERISRKNMRKRTIASFNSSSSNGIYD